MDDTKHDTTSPDTDDMNDTNPQSPEPESETTGATQVSTGATDTPTKNKGGRPRTPTGESLEDVRHRLYLETTKSKPDRTKVAALTALLDDLRKDATKADAVAKDEQRIELAHTKTLLEVTQEQNGLLTAQNELLTSENRALRDAQQRAVSESERLCETVKNLETTIQALKNDVTKATSAVEDSRRKLLTYAMVDLVVNRLSHHSPYGKKILDERKQLQASLTPDADAELNRLEAEEATAVKREKERQAEEDAAFRLAKERQEEAIVKKMREDIDRSQQESARDTRERVRLRDGSENNFGLGWKK
jgi:hypothetical protein